MHAVTLFVILVALIGERILQNQNFNFKNNSQLIPYTIISILPFLIIKPNLILFIVYIIYLAIRITIQITLFKRHSNIALLITVPLIFIIIPFLELNEMSLNYTLFTFFQSINNHAVINVVKTELNSIYIALIGFFVVGFEVNNLVRFLLKKYHFLPENSDSDKSKNKSKSVIENEELKRGYAIGLIERVLIFLLIWVGRTEAVSLVIAVKGVYRYRSLDDKNFAEYVLLGTLLSMLSAIITSYVLIKILA